MLTLEDIGKMVEEYYYYSEKKYVTEIYIPITVEETISFTIDCDAEMWKELVETDVMLNG